ncbi:methyl-accepting chemotaxis protein [Effusibacillus consociatus]|uniref:Methyl-accepting chemotaxis protein n=1 Tax=Effusibacillus consociatus TaxID=1117041 RepID=A0ABV9PZE9_9BACL
MTRFFRFFQLNVRNKLILFGTTILLVPCLVIGFISYQTAKNKVEEQIFSAARDNVELLNHVITKHLEPSVRNVEYFSQRMTADVFQGMESPIVRQQLDQFAKLNPEIKSTYVGTETGLMILSPNEKLPDGYDPRKRPWYQDAMKSKGKVIITDPYVDAVSGANIVTIAKTTVDGSGVMAVDITLENLEKVVKQAKIGKQGYVALVDKNKKILVHPTAKPGTDVLPVIAEKAFGSPSGEFEYEFEGVQKKEFFATNTLTGWKLTGTMDFSEVEAEAAPIWNKTLLILAIAFLIGSAVNYFIIISITRPLRALVDASEKISAGDLTEQVEVKSNDELGQLGMSFNEMAKSLRALIFEVRKTSEQLAASSEELTASSEQTSKATEQIAVTIQEVAGGSEKQARSVEESSKAVNELSIGVQQIAANAQNVSSTAMQASNKALEGNKAIQTAVEQINSISGTVNGLSQMVKGLGERSKEIGQIVEVITGIAEQTNLLALNAAIEAARAGEQGRGFAVVADEVRKLAEQSGQSAQQIAQLITAIQNETNKAVESMESGTKEVSAGIEVISAAGRSFDQILSAVNQVTTQIQEVSAASQQMSAGTEQMVNTISVIAEEAETTSAGMQNVSAASEEQLATMEEISASAAALATMAEELQTLVRKFKI